ncbi:MAG: hypothetical protein ACP5UA_04150 [Candidatus Hydrogenedens sp.]
MIESLIILTIVGIAIFYVIKTFKNIFLKKEKSCETCACQKCPYTNTSECPVKTLDKSNKYTSSLPKEFDKDRSIKVIVGYEKFL